MLPAEERLRRRSDFAAVYDRKKSWGNALLALYIRQYSAQGPMAETRRFGFSVSKKVGKAHVRNQVKRRLREICRLQQEQWRAGFDAVFVARSASASASYLELEAAVCQLMQKAHLTGNTPINQTGKRAADGGGTDSTGVSSGKSPGNTRDTSAPAAQPE